ncbi:MAG: hypothetical protein ABL308_08760 [Oceanicaulis sp.]
MGPGAATRRRLLASMAGLAMAAPVLGGCAGGATYRSGRGAPPERRVLILPPHTMLGQRVMGGRFDLRRDWSEVLRPVLIAQTARMLDRRGRTPVFLDSDDDLDQTWRLVRLGAEVSRAALGSDRDEHGGRNPPTRGLSGPFSIGPGGAGLMDRHAAPTAVLIAVTGDWPAGMQRVGEYFGAASFGVRREPLRRELIVAIVALEDGRIVWAGSRRDRDIRDPRKAARHVRGLLGKAWLNPEPRPRRRRRLGRPVT